MKKKMLITLVMILPILMLIAVVILDVQVVMADAEPNDDFDRAELIAPSNYTGTFLDPEDDKRDFYRITNVKPGQEIEVKCAFSIEGLLGAESSVTLYDEDWAVLVENTISSNTLSWAVNSAESSYEYYIQVGLDFYAYDIREEPNVSYSLYVSIIDHYDADSETDAGNSFDSALDITSGNYVSYLSLGKQGSYTNVGGNDVEDYYRIDQTLTTGQSINVKVTPATDQALRVHVYDPNRAEIAYGYSANPSAIVRINVTVPQPGTYYINVAQGTPVAGYDLNPPVSGDYSMEISTAAGQPPSPVTMNKPTDTNYASVRLDWTKSEETDFNKYEIYQSTSLGTIGILIHTITDRATTYYTVTGLSAETTYYFTVRVFDISDLNADSNQVEVKTTATDVEEANLSPAWWLEPEVIIGVGVGGTGLTAALALIIQVWRTGKGFLEILKDLKGLFSGNKRREKKKEENQKT
jgi:hypothetical protein